MATVKYLLPVTTLLSSLEDTELLARMLLSRVWVCLTPDLMQPLPSWDLWTLVKFCSELLTSWVKSPSAPALHTSEVMETCGKPQESFTVEQLPRAALKQALPCVNSLLELATHHL